MTDQRLTLKVKIVRPDSCGQATQAVVRSFEIPVDFTVEQACDFIYDTTADIAVLRKTNAGRSCLGLLRLREDIGVESKRGNWLDPSAVIGSLQLSENEILELRIRRINLRIVLPDARHVEWYADLAEKVEDFLGKLCDENGIAHSEEYGAFIKATAVGDKKDKTIGDRKTWTQHQDTCRKWLNPVSSLADYDLDENDELFVRRRFFFSDRNVDTSDLSQLDLLYFHCRDDVLAGSLFVTPEQGVELAALQCQVELSDHDPTKVIRTRERLPAELAGCRNMEKKVIQAYSELSGTTEVNAKLAYVRCCQHLPTYGFTFFLVKEKVKGKRKLISRLLGVNKDSVARMDVKTRMIVQSWPLTHIKRWGSSGNTFTLDLGDYAESHYTVQTKDGADIGELISGYINLTLKRRTVPPPVSTDRCNDVVEEIVSAQKAAIVQETLPQASKYAETFVCHAGSEKSQKMERKTVQKISDDCLEARSANVPTKMDEVLHFVSGLLHETRQFMGCRSSTPKMLAADDFNSSIHKQYALSRLSYVACESSRLAFHSLNRDDTQWALCAGVSLFSGAINVRDLLCDISGSSLTCLMDNHQQDGVTLTDQLYNTFEQIVNNLKFGNPENVQKVLSAAGEIGLCCKTIQQKIVKIREEQDSFVARAKAVAADVASLVIQARRLASSNPAAIVPSATRCTLCASQLVAVAKASELIRFNSRTREMLARCAEQLAKAAEEMMNICELLDRETYRCVMDSLNVLKNSSTQISHGQSSGVFCDTQQTLQSLLSAVEAVLSSTDPTAVRSFAREALEASADLLCLLTELAQQCDADTARFECIQSDLKELADATTAFNLVIDSGSAVSGDNDELIAACDSLSTAGIRAANWSLHRPILRDTDACISEAVNVAIQVLAAVSSWQPEFQSAAARKNLASLTELVHELIRAVSQAEHCESLPARVHLIFVADDFHTRCTCLLSDFAQLKATSRNVAEQLAEGRLLSSLDDLRLILNEMKIYTDQLVDMYCLGFSNDLLRTVRALNRDLDLDEFYCLPKSQKQQIGTKVDRFVFCFRHVNSSVQRLTELATGTLKTTASCQSLTEQCRVLVGQLIELVRSVRRLTAVNCGQEELQVDPGCRTFLIGQVKNVLELAFLIIIAAGRMMCSNQNVDTLRDRFYCSLLGDTPSELFEQTCQKVSVALEDCTSILPGHMELCDLVKQLNTSANRILAQRVPTVTHPRCVSDLNCLRLLCELNRAIDSVCGCAFCVFVVISEGIASLSNAVSEFVIACQELLGVGIDFAVFFKNQLAVRKYLLQLRKIHTSALSFTDVIRRHGLSQLDENGEDDPAFVAGLVNAHRQLIHRLDELSLLALSVAPNRCIYEYTTSRLKYARELSFKIISPVNNMSLVEANEQLIQHSKELGEFVSKIAECAQEKRQLIDRITDCVQTAASAALGVVESSTQAAYLVAITPDGCISGSQPKGEPSVFDQVVFVKCKESIVSACQAITQPSGGQLQRYLATALEFSVLLSNAARNASCRIMSNQAASSYFLQRSREISCEACELIRAVCALQTSCFMLTAEILESARRLEQSVEALYLYATSKKFSVIPSPINLQGREAQRPIVISICQVIDGTIGLIECLNSLSSEPPLDDRAIWQQLSNYTHNISDGIKSLVVRIRGCVPGHQVCEFALDQLQQLSGVLNGSRSFSFSGPTSVTDSLRHKYVDGMVYETMCLGDLLEQICVTCDDISNSEDGLLGNLISQFVMAEESLLHNVLCLSKAELLTTSEELIKKAVCCINTSIEFISAVNDVISNRHTLGARQRIEHIWRLKDKCRETNDELLELIVRPDCTPSATTPVGDEVTRNRTQSAASNGPTRQPGNLRVNPEENMYEIARSLIENTRSLVTKASVSKDASLPVMDAIERLTSLLSLENEKEEPANNRESLLDAVRRVSDSLSALIDNVASKPELSTSDLELLEEAYSIKFTT